MLTAYIQAAMRHATYKLLDDGTFFGEIPDLQGVWGNADYNVHSFPQALTRTPVMSPPSTLMRGCQAPVAGSRRWV